MKVLLIASLAFLVGFAQAACPKSCSGHGTCGVDEVVSLFFQLLSCRCVVCLFFRSLTLLLHLFSQSKQHSAHAILDGARTVMLEEIVLNDFVRTSWHGLTIQLEVEVNIHTLNVLVKELVIESRANVNASLDMKARLVHVSLVQEIALVMELVNT